MAITDDVSFLSKLGCFQICYLHGNCTSFPLFRGFLILVISNVSLWLFLVFSWLLFCLLLLVAWSNKDNIEISLSVCSGLSWVFFDGKSFKWIIWWNSIILLIIQFVFFAFTSFINCNKFFCAGVDLTNILFVELITI